MVAAGSRCAPPIGSGTTSSISSSCSRSCAVNFNASAAAWALSALRQRIDAQPSGEITEYMLCSSITKWFAVASAIAPPDPPSPMMTLMTGTRTLKTGIYATGNGLGLAAFFRADARIGARRVDKCQNG